MLKEEALRAAACKDTCAVFVRAALHAVSAECLISTRQRMRQFLKGQNPPADILLRDSTDRVPNYLALLTVNLQKHLFSPRSKRKLRAAPILTDPPPTHEFRRHQRVDDLRDRRLAYT